MATATKQQKTKNGQTIRPMSEWFDYWNDTLDEARGEVQKLRGVVGTTLAFANGGQSNAMAEPPDFSDLHGLMALMSEHLEIVAGKLNETIEAMSRRQAAFEEKGR